ncbi:Glycoside hydrolase family 3 protein [Mycena indigotica]|uniref:Glycoside hydrolase family 3 protein n=1 Tax=Mycena indigotica TaxID=2126181 RepID=A0A8H6SMI7_9AGAR|nr:Glycoside hydrolase family 3 protein [Mycena indigotica]KAF7300972.1 Glycoside hydrolase family 3 protein [Mycena indigotica]
MAILSRQAKARSIKDPIHDFMGNFSKQVSAIIDTPHFQRLRHIKQLGTTYRVYPGASHNRFEHCLGVAHLARSMAVHLQSNQPELGITDRDVECVQIAGLCHDLGHGPYSHVWDGLFIPSVAPEKNWKHEDASKMMFDDLIKFLKRKGIVEETAFPEKDVKFVLALIDGDPAQCDPEEKPFLFDIVANKRNGIDVDKFDYIARDRYMMGISSQFPSSRIIQSARVINNEICYDIKDVNILHDIGTSRFGLHKQQYNHKTAKAIEYMIVDALKLAEPHMKIATRIDVPEEFLHLTDNIELEIKASRGPELQASRDLLDDIDIRNLYKLVDDTFVDWENQRIFRQRMTSQRIVEAAKRIAAEEAESLDLGSLTPETVIVDQTTMHYGMKEKNPLDFVKFYSKHNPDQCALAQRGDYSTLLPQYFAEIKLSVITKLPQYFGVVQAGYRAVLKSIQDEIMRPTTPTRTGHSRVSSFGSLDGNSLTRVPLNFSLATPGKPITGKRSLGSIDEGDDERSAKRQARSIE